MKTVIKYQTRSTGYVYWELKYEDGSGIHIFAAQENGTESNKRKAKKAAEHSKRLTDTAISKRNTT